MVILTPELASMMLDVSEWRAASSHRDWPTTVLETALRTLAWEASQRRTLPARVYAIEQKIRNAG